MSKKKKNPQSIFNFHGEVSGGQQQYIEHTGGQLEINYMKGEAKDADITFKMRPSEKVYYTEFCADRGKPRSTYTRKVVMHHMKLEGIAGQTGQDVFDMIDRAVHVYNLLRQEQMDRDREFAGRAMKQVSDLLRR